MDEKKESTIKLLLNIIHFIGLGRLRIAAVVVGTTLGVAFASLIVFKDGGRDYLAETALIAGVVSAILSIGSELRRSKVERLYLKMLTDSIIGKIKLDKDARRRTAITVAYVAHVKGKSRLMKAALATLMIATFFMQYWTPGIRAAEATAMCLVAFLLIVAHEYILEYRVKNGYFGNTASEAKKLVEYVIKNADSINFDDNDGSPRRTFEPEKEASGQEVIFPGTAAY
ncbi:hypothetical protein [Xanthomonas campestris]|uniref:hypothetical protein n=1 Tax=Xanthomonas campestris TaxID=339 RepID=UPI001290431D|nr:hypothetical protein [Xanthomonas campestris]